MITQMGFYCLPVELIVNSANKISDLMFESQWYESSVNELKRSLTLVLSRAQKSIVFSGYGLVWINLRTFLMVYKTAFTLYTFLNVVAQKNS
ncbi:hypothetical protein MTP99_015103 [Tenebrio molitor]|nr:hypothetical protein MTP99_015103 [Tenebrio molitor]